MVPLWARSWRPQLQPPPRLQLHRWRGGSSCALFFSRARCCCSQSVAAELRIASRHYTPPVTPFTARGLAEEGGWTQEGETNEWYRFLVRVGSTPLGISMREHFMRRTTAGPTELASGGNAGPARPPYEHACAWRNFAEEFPEEFEAAVPSHLAYGIRKLAAFVSGGASSGDAAGHMARDGALQLLSRGTALDALQMALRSSSLRPHDRLLVTEATPLALLDFIRAECAMARVDVVVAALPPWQSLDGDTEHTSALLAAAMETHLSDCHVAVFEQECSTTGIRLPLSALAASCERQGVTMIVEGSRALGLEEEAGPLSPLTAGADYFVAELHGWFSSSKTTAMLWQRNRRCAEVAPAACAAAAEKEVSAEEALVVPSSLSSALAVPSGSVEDFSAVLSVPTVLDFWRTVGFGRARGHCRLQLADALALCEREWMAAPGQLGQNRRWSNDGDGDGDDDSVDSTVLATVGGTALLPIDSDSSGSTIALVVLPAPLQAGQEASAARIRWVESALLEWGVRCTVVPLQGLLWLQLSAHVYRDTAAEAATVVSALSKLADSEHARQQEALRRRRLGLGDVLANDSAPVACVVYKSLRSSMYVYVEDAAALERLPQRLAVVLGALEPCGVAIELGAADSARSLAGGSTTVGEVRRRLAKVGYFMSRAAVIY